MYKKHILIAILTIALVTMACGININLPDTQIKTGPTVTDDISIPPLDDPNTIPNVHLAFGAGEMTIGPGAGEALISGTATYNVADFKPETSITGNRVTLDQGDLNITGIPRFDEDIENKWDLQFGSTPIKLNINAGAYKADYDFGGLALYDLEIGDGAADVDLTFSEPNLVEMDTFSYTTGASDVTLENLANANFDSMFFRCGAGSYSLDFSGELQRNATVTIETGISNIKVIVPEGVSARVSFEGGLSNVDANGAWGRSGGDYIQDGSGPTITFIIKMGAGSLELNNP